MIKRIYKTVAIMMCTGCLGLLGCNSTTLNEDVNSLLQSTIVDLGTIFVSTAVDNAFGVTN